MGTRSNIGYEHDNGKIEAIYCHWDGYPSNNGAILLEHYTSRDKVKQLVKLGSLSSLGAELGDKHDFDNPPKGQCNAYGRDRGGMDGVKPKRFANLEAYFEAMEDDCFIEYAYIMRADGSWVVGCPYKAAQPFVPLTRDIVDNGVPSQREDVEA